MLPILLLTHNGLALTKQAVRSVRKQDVDTHLVIIDNGSTDGTLPWLHTLDPGRTTVMALGQNRGVSRGWNLGLRWLFDREQVPAVLVINNDVVLRPETARALCCAGTPASEVTCPGNLFVTAVGMNTLSESQQNWLNAPRSNPDFSCFLLRREAWMRVGEFDERMFAWCSDNDYHVRLTRAGIWAGTCGIPFYHVAAATVKGSESDKDARARWRELFERDRRAFAAKWGGLMPGTKEYERATTLPAETMTRAQAAAELFATAPAPEASAGTAAASPAPPDASTVSAP